MYKILFICLAAVSISACESEPEESLQRSLNTPAVTHSAIAIFNPAAGIIPFPSDLLFSGTVDGSLNIPVDESNPADGPKVAINALDGFSTIAPISTTFASAINETTIPGNVKMFEVTTDNFFNNPAGPPTTAVISASTELTFGVDFVAAVSSQTTLVILPMKALEPKQGYLVVITNGLTSTDGVAFVADSTYALAKSSTSLLDGTTSLIPALDDDEAAALEPLRLLTNAAEAVAASQGVIAADIVLSWSFTTQSISDVLSIVKAELPASPTVSAFTKVSSAVVDGLIADDLPVNTVDIYTGTIDVPYYLDKTNPLTGSWKGADGKLLSLLNAKDPLETETLSIPVLITVPTGATLDNGGAGTGIPVTIFQHGITRDRTTVLTLADTLASEGRALIAIDLPLHGVTDISSAFYDSTNERTFNLDLVSQNSAGSVTDVVADQSIDSTGLHFINLTSLLTSRDNVRQAIADLFSLTNAIGVLDVGTAGVDFDTDKISFIGHSLGGIVGVPFLALENRVGEAVIAMAGGGIAKILDGSAAFGPEISAGLALNGVIKGSTDFEGFMLATQTVLDSSDPINYAVAAAANHNILFFEIVGGAGSPSDLVVPNKVPDDNDTSGTSASLLSGTDALIAASAMNLTASNSNGASGDLLIKFAAGHHNSLITPLNNTGLDTVSGSASVNTEMLTNLASYISSGGTVSISDPDSVIAAP